MKEWVKGGFALLIFSFLLALIQSCSMDNGIIKPACLISEVDLEEKWWYPQDSPGEPAIYFKANGQLKVEGQPDQAVFQLENCNKLRVTDQSGNTQEVWVIKGITESSLTLQYPSKMLVNYSKTR